MSKVLFACVALSGCVPLMMAEGKAQKECSLEVDTLTTSQNRPPVAGFDGEWQCMWNDAEGNQFVESLTFTARGNTLLRMGRDNFNNNLTADVAIDGDTLRFRAGAHFGWRLTMDPGGRILDGEIKSLAQNGQNAMGTSACLTTRYTCRRRR
jgi:hypothetical protein